MERKLRRSKEHKAFFRSLFLEWSDMPYPYATPEWEKAQLSLDEEAKKNFRGCKSCQLWCPQGHRCLCGCHECLENT